jgi:hypothetical protein
MFTNVQEGGTIPSTDRGETVSPLCARMFVALAGSELNLWTGTTVAPTQPVPSEDHFLAPAIVKTLGWQLVVDNFFGPIIRGAAAMLGKTVD